MGPPDAQGGVSSLRGLSSPALCPQPRAFPTELAEHLEVSWLLQLPMPRRSAPVRSQPPPPVVWLKKAVRTLKSGFRGTQHGEWLFSALRPLRAGSEGAIERPGAGREAASDSGDGPWVLLSRLLHGLTAGVWVRPLCRWADGHQVVPWGPACPQGRRAACWAWCQLHRARTAVAPCPVQPAFWNGQVMPCPL